MSVDDARASIELTALPNDGFVGQTITLRILFALDHDFFATAALPLVARPLDLPIAVTFPSIAAGHVERAIAPAEAVAVTRSVIVDGEPASARFVGSELRDGRSFDRYWVERALAFDEPGALELAAPTLRFAHATRFETSLFGDRIAVDRVESELRGTPRHFTVKPLPEAGRPSDFAGAVGRFNADAALDRTEWHVGETARLTITLRGDGDLARLPLPRADALPGIHRLGLLDERIGDARVLRCDLVAIADDVREIGPIGFATFDPGDAGRPCGYRVVATRPLPVTLVGTSGTTDGAAPGAFERSAGNGVVLTMSALVLFALAATLLLAFLRRRRGAIRVVEEVASVASDPCEQFAQRIAARLGSATASAFAPGLERRLVAAGIAAAIARSIVARLAALSAAKYDSPTARGAALPDEESAITAALRRP